MGYRTWNNYEEAAERERRAAWAVLPLQRRIAIRTRQIVILAVTIGLPAVLIARAYGVF